MQFKTWAVLTQSQNPLRNTSDFPILLHYPHRYLSKSNLMDEFSFSKGWNNPSMVFVLFCFVLYMHYKDSIPFCYTGVLIEQGWLFWQIP